MRKSSSFYRLLTVESSGHTLYHYKDKKFLYDCGIKYFGARWKFELYNKTFLMSCLFSYRINTINLKLEMKKKKKLFQNLDQSITFNESLRRSKVTGGWNSISELKIMQNNAHLAYAAIFRDNRVRINILYKNLFDYIISASYRSPFKRSSINSASKMCQIIEIVCP